jgi:hypothetical protein
MNRHVILDAGLTKSSGRDEHDGDDADLVRRSGIEGGRHA